MKKTDTIAAYRPLVLARTKSFIKQRRDRLPDDSEWQADVLKRLESFSGQGKLLRGNLVCYSYAICKKIAVGPGSDLPPAVLDTAVALELFHASLLIQDDVIDQDELRRGQPAIHRQYHDLAARRHLPGASRLGENLALCASDIVLLMAVELLTAAQADPAVSGSLTELFIRELSIVCAGQMQDIYLSALAVPPAKRDIYEVMRAKTAAYSVALPLAAGAILAGQATATNRELYAIGMAAGTMFQIRDDELGALGQSSRIGKPVGSDIREGKKTLLYYYLWQAAAKGERQKLANIFRNPTATPADIKYVQQAMRGHDIAAKLRQDIDKLEQTAFGHIAKLKLPETDQQELRSFVSFCAARKL